MSDEAIQAVKEIYAELAGRPIMRNCTGISQCCRFRLNGRTPFLTKGEALVAAHSWRAAGRKEVVPAAGGPYARHEVRDLIQRLETIDRELGGNGGVNLPVAVAEAMDALPAKKRRR